MSELRERILNEALRVYSEAGFRGTTTRRIATQAEVNEVTLFRHFGTKEALIKEAIARARLLDLPRLDRPEDPPAELFQWTLALFTKWYHRRHLICRIMGDMVEHPEIAPTVCSEPTDEHGQLTAYLQRMQAEGWTALPFIPEAAAGLVTGAIFTHAVWRDHFPESPEPEFVVRQYVDLLLQSIGARPVAGARTHSPE